MSSEPGFSLPGVPLPGSARRSPDATLHGTELTAVLCGHRLRVLRDTPDGPYAVLEAGLPDVVAFEFAASLPDSADADAEPEIALALIHLADDALLDGVRLGGMPCVIETPFTDIDEVVAFVCHGNLLLDRVHRRRLEPVDLTPPLPEPTPGGPRRPDVVAAAHRTIGGPVLEQHVLALSAVARPDEYVLEFMLDRTGTLACVTTLRFFELVKSTGVVREASIDALEQARVAKDATGEHLRLELADMAMAVRYGHEQEWPRLAGAVMFAIARRRDDDVYEPGGPSSADVFEQWRIAERDRELGLLAGDAALRRYMALAARATRGDRP